MRGFLRDLPIAVVGGVVGAVPVAALVLLVRRGPAVATAFATIVAAMAGAVGAIMAWLAARAARDNAAATQETADATLKAAAATTHAAEAQLFAEYRRTYGSLEMLEALRNAGLERGKSRDSHVDDFSSNLRTGGDYASRWQGYRRTISDFFLGAFHLYEAGYVSRTFIREIIRLSGYDVFRDVVQDWDEVNAEFNDMPSPRDRYNRMDSLRADLELGDLATEVQRGL